MTTLVKIILNLIFVFSIVQADIIPQEAQLKLSKIMNSQFPKKIDEITTAVDFYITVNKFVYTYEVKGIKSRNNLNTTKIITRMNNAMCTYPTMRRFINDGIILKYIYRNETSKEYIFSFEIDKNVCSKLK